ncbi:MAG: sigma-70 family RNA polymerase sigma factor [Pyrinomonadaceae bacterium]|nr:sigma-70 family RNA polymerase sigma factor [Pyrinomonadaceae bacterium]
MVIDGDGQLIERARSGDREAFGLLARRFERRVYSLALFYTRNHGDAEDLSQEVWLKVYRHLESFRGESSFYTWLRQITVNTFLNHRRSSIRHVGGEPQPLRLVEIESVDYEDTVRLARGASMEDDLHRKMMVERVEAALTELTPQQRLIFILKHNEGMTYEEISAALNCSTGTIKKSLFRAVQKLRHHLGLKSESRNYLRCAAGGK